MLNYIFSFLERLLYPSHPEMNAPHNKARSHFIFIIVGGFLSCFFSMRNVSILMDDRVLPRRKFNPTQQDAGANANTSSTKATNVTNDSMQDLQSTPTNTSGLGTKTGNLLMCIDKPGWKSVTVPEQKHFSGMTCDLSTTSQNMCEFLHRYEIKESASYISVMEACCFAGV